MAVPGDAPLALLKTLFGALFLNYLAGLFVGAAGSMDFAALSVTLSDYSRHDFTQHQLFAILVLRLFLKKDYRGISICLSISQTCAKC